MLVNPARGDTIWYHTTTPDRLGSILRDGLRCGSPPTCHAAPEPWIYVATRPWVPGLEAVAEVETVPGATADGLGTAAAQAEMETGAEAEAETAGLRAEAAAEAVAETGAATKAGAGWAEAVGPPPKPSPPKPSPAVDRLPVAFAALTAVVLEVDLRDVPERLAGWPFVDGPESESWARRWQLRVMCDVPPERLALRKQWRAAGGGRGRVGATGMGEA